VLLSEAVRLDTKVPFTRADAIAAGLDMRLLRGSRFRRLFRGVYIDATVPLTPKIRALGALSLHPTTAFASHQTGAALRQLPIQECDRVHVSVLAQEERVQRPGIACHIGCSEATIERVRGVRVSAPLDLFIELAGVLSLLDLVVVGDAMVRIGMFSPRELRTFCASTKRWHARRARRGAMYVRDGVDSPMETRLRMLLVLAGLPEPVTNFKIRDEHGHVLRRLDLSYPAARVIVEYNGRQHDDDFARWSSDIERREEFDDDGWRLIVVLSPGIYREPEQTILRVATVLRKRGVRVGPIRDDWRIHFPVG
jgi:very-short-patch-repair endonuclease